MIKMYEFLKAFEVSGITSAEIEKMFSVFVDMPKRSIVAQTVISTRLERLTRFIRRNGAKFRGIPKPSEDTISAMKNVIALYNTSNADGKSKIQKDAFLASGILWVLGNEEFVEILKQKETPLKQVIQRPNEIIDTTDSGAHTEHTFIPSRRAGKDMNSIREKEVDHPFRVKKGYKGRRKS